MPPEDPATPHEASSVPVEIRLDAAITIPEALLIATTEAFPIGKSTLQRWAKTWGLLGAASPVKSVLVTTRTGAAYRVDRDDFTAWLIEQKQNMRPGEMLKDPAISPETSRDPVKPHETSRDLDRHHETSRDLSRSSRASTDRPRSYSESEEDRADSLRDENMQLKIDVEVRKQLLNQAAGEISRQRDHIEKLLRENGGLQSQVLQLASPLATHHAALMEPRAAHAGSNEQGTTMHQENGDNRPFTPDGELQ